MMRPSDLAGLLSAAVLIVASLVAVGQAAGLRRSRRVLLAGAGAALALAPVGALPLAGLLRAVLGELSLTTLLLLLLGLGRQLRGGPPGDARSACALRWLVLAGGLALYPLALGLGAWDPYRLGYGEPWLLAALLLLALAALGLDLGLVAMCLALGVLAWGLGIYESRNLWDYLIDPLLFGWALLTLTLQAAGRLRRSRSRSSS